MLGALLLAAASAAIPAAPAALIAAASAAQPAPPGALRSGAAVEGFLDAADCAFVEGWAWNAAAPARRVVVEVLEGGRVVARAPATGFRRDLVTGGKGDGRHAFRLPLPRALRDGLPHLLTARAEGRRLAGARTIACAWSWLAGRPRILAPAERAEGTVPFEGGLPGSGGIAVAGDVDRALVSAAHARGLFVIAATEDVPQMRRLLALGVDGLATGRRDVAEKLIDEPPPLAVLQPRPLR